MKGYPTGDQENTSGLQQCRDLMQDKNSDCLSKLAKERYNPGNNLVSYYANKGALCNLARNRKSNLLRNNQRTSQYSSASPGGKTWTRQFMPNCSCRQCE